jgi:hypothetical protein
MVVVDLQEKQNKKKTKKKKKKIEKKLIDFLEIIARRRTAAAPRYSRVNRQQSSSQLVVGRIKKGDICEV